MKPLKSANGSDFQGAGVFSLTRTNWLFSEAILTRVNRDFQKVLNIV